MRRPVTALVLSSALAASAAAQGASFEARSSVVLIEVPVQVTSRSGEPLRGLRAEDFRLFDEGRRQQVAGFQVVDLAAPAAGSGGLGDRLPAVARRHFLFLFDLSFSSPAALVRAREAAQRFVLRSLRPSDLAAVATFTLESGPRLLVTFTPDRAQLARAIDTLGVPGVMQNPAAVDPLRFVIEDPVRLTLPATEDGSSASAPLSSSQLLLDTLGNAARRLEHSDRSFEQRRLLSWSRALAEMARRLASLAGRKQVIYFSEGFDDRLLLGRGPSTHDLEARHDRRNLERGDVWRVDGDDLYGSGTLRSEMHRTLESFRRADCVIHAVDAGGLRGDAATDGDLMTAGTAPEKRPGESGLHYLAEATGGVLISGFNDLGEALERRLERTEVTYVLSFYPSEAGEAGEYRRLEVEVEGEGGARLSHRPGYFVPRPFPELHPLEKDLLAAEAIVGVEARSELETSVLAVPFHDGPRAYVPVIVELPGPPLLAQHTAGELELELYAYATDLRGEVRDLFTDRLRFDLHRERRALAAGGVQYYGHLELAPGTHLLRVLARNTQTGRVGVTAVELEVPDFAAGGSVLLPPLFEDRRAGWLRRREATEVGPDGRVTYPFLAGGEPYVPTAERRLTSAGETRFHLVAYGLGDGEPRLEATLEGGGRTLPASDRLQLLASGGPAAGPRTLTLGFDARGLTTGAYVLAITWHEAGGGRSAGQEVAITVVDGALDPPSGQPVH